MLSVCQLTVAKKTIGDWLNYVWESVYNNIEFMMNAI